MHPPFERVCALTPSLGPMEVTGNSQKLLRVETLSHASEGHNRQIMGHGFHGFMMHFQINSGLLCHGSFATPIGRSW